MKRTITIPMVCDEYAIGSVGNWYFCSRGVLKFFRLSKETLRYQTRAWITLHTQADEDTVAFEPQQQRRPWDRRRAKFDGKPFVIMPDLHKILTHYYAKGYRYGKFWYEVTE